VRHVIYWLLISSNISLREFSGEIFLTYLKEFDLNIEICERQKWINNFSKNIAENNIKLSKEIIFMIGQSYKSDEIAFGRERTESVFQLFKEFRDHIVIKIHPGSNRQKYFEGKIFDDSGWHFYDEDVPIEMLLGEVKLAISLGSTGLVNTSNAGIDSICIGRIGNYPFGNLGNDFYKHFENTNPQHYIEIVRMSELRNLLISHTEK
jgi:hypothetical protein